jgi:hypothetical protein
MDMRYIYVTSDNRDTTRYPYSNSYVMDLIEPIKDITEVALMSARVPNTLYNLDHTPGSNILSVVTSVGTSNITINPGFYTANDIVTAVTSVIPASNPWTIEFVPYEGKFLFTSPNLTSVNVLTTQAQQMIGISNLINATLMSADPVYKNYTSYTAGTKFVKSPNISDPVIQSYIFLDIDELKSPYIHDTRSNPYATSLMNHCFGVVPLDVAFGTFKAFKESDFKLSIKFKHPVSSLSRLTIRWLDRNGNVVNFNGLEDNSFMIRVCSQAKNLEKLKYCS